jgi:hypothetical protein
MIMMMTMIMMRRTTTTMMVVGWFYLCQDSEDGEDMKPIVADGHVHQHLLNGASQR